MTGDERADGSGPKEGPWALDGTWVLESLGTPPDEPNLMLETVEPPATSTMTFADGAVFGSGGVNRFRGTYETDGAGALTFGGVAATRMAGSPAAMSHESRFFAALTATVAVEIVGGHLELRGTDGEVLAVLVRALEDAGAD